MEDDCKTVNSPDFWLSSISTLVTKSVLNSERIVEASVDEDLLPLRTLVAVVGSFSRGFDGLLLLTFGDAFFVSFFKGKGLGVGDGLRLPGKLMIWKVFLVSLVIRFQLLLEHLE